MTECSKSLFSFATLKRQGLKFVNSQVHWNICLPKTGPLSSLQKGFLNWTFRAEVRRQVWWTLFWSCYDLSNCRWKIPSSSYISAYQLLRPNWNVSLPSRGNCWNEKVRNFQTTFLCFQWPFIGITGHSEQRTKYEELRGNEKIVRKARRGAWGLLISPQFITSPYSYFFFS